jgi:hypothetical protein
VGVAPIKDDGRVTNLEVLGDCNSTLIVVEVVGRGRAGN